MEQAKHTVTIPVRDYNELITGMERINKLEAHLQLMTTNLKMQISCDKDKFPTDVKREVSQDYSHSHIIFFYE